MAKKAQYSSCDIPPTIGRKTGNRNRLYSFRDNFTWKGVEIEEYKTKGDDWEDVARQVLIGASGESTKFHLRYFEIKPGGYSSFETHKHEHVVICIRGKGKAKLDRRVVNINHLDVLYINPETPHRLYNPYNDAFGFFCIVNARRDRPKPVKKQGMLNK